MWRYYYRLRDIHFRIKKKYSMKEIFLALIFLALCTISDLIDNFSNKYFENVKCMVTHEENK